MKYQNKNEQIKLQKDIITLLIVALTSANLVLLLSLYNII